MSSTEKPIWQPPAGWVSEARCKASVVCPVSNSLHSGEANQIFAATVGRNSVLVLDEAPHARQRRALVPPLKGERMRAFFDAIRLETLAAVRAWPVGKPFPVLPSMRRVTLRVILRGRLVGEVDPRTVTPEQLGAAMTGAAAAEEKAS